MIRGINFGRGAAMIYGAALTAGAAHAGTYNFTNITAGASAANMATGESQFTMDVSDAGAGMVLFTFFNSVPNASSIPNIYWDDADDLLSAITNIFDDPNDVDFSEGGAPPVLPGGESIGFSEDFRVSAASPPSMRGVNPGEQLGVQFSLEGGVSFLDVISGLDTGGLRVGLRGIAFADGGSASFVNNGTIIPLPSAAVLGLAGVSFVGASRRRRDGF